MNFENYAHSFQVCPNPGLARIAALTDKLGHPEKGLTYIHVAGTNGKGSVAVSLASVLTAAGYRTGLYTSPNLVRVNERVQIDGVPISDEDLARVIGRIEGAAEEVRSETGEMPTPFEIWTAAAFLWFHEKQCDRVVLEVGLGGELDATNVIDAPELAVITHIDLDHTALLGNTVEEIARAKCGIIKPGCTVVSAEQCPEAENVIRAAASDITGKEAVFAEAPAPGKFDEFYEIADFEGVGEITLPFGGVHQLQNMALTVRCAALLGVDPSSVRSGLARARHPARMEVLRHSPYLLYDGGHNPDGIRSLTRSLARYTPGQRWTVIFAAMRDKDVLPSLRELSRSAERFFFTTVQNNPRAMSPEELTARAAAGGIAGTPIPTLTDALTCAGESPTLVCGSLYLYADLPAFLRGV